MRTNGQGSLLPPSTHFWEGDLTLGAKLVRIMGSSCLNRSSWARGPGQGPSLPMSNLLGTREFHYIILLTFKVILKTFYIKNF